MQLDHYTTGSYTPGASALKQLLWFFIGTPLLHSYLLPVSSLKVWLLRCFGAKVGAGVRIKPGVRVKFPWRLHIGDHCWIGENAWIDTVAPVIIENHVCISQGVYLCTGNHDWSDPSFQLRTGPICVQSGSWIAARAIVGPGVTIGQGAVLALGSVAGKNLESMTIYSGNPAVPIKKRVIRDQPFSISENALNPDLLIR
jgi:putative colanic acid biosynthesis acetyltransferase WcaF